MSDSVEPRPAAPLSPDRRTETRPENASFLELVRQRERGKLKLYIGSAAGTGKTTELVRRILRVR